MASASQPLDEFEPRAVSQEDTGNDAASSSTPPRRLSVIVPAFNEALRLEGPLRSIVAWLEARPEGAELIVVDDGSDDRTFEIAESVAANASIPVAVAGYSRNRGKGFALKVGFELARGELLLFCDADLATPIEEAPRLVDALEAGADVAIGSRKMPGATIRTHQPRLRENLGKVFTWLVRRSIADVSDVTCGFKAFRRAVGRDLFRLVRLYDWSFDAEVLMLATRRRCSIAEVPVTWEDKPGTKVRLVRDATRSLADLVRLRRNLGAGVYREENRVSPSLREFHNDAWNARATSPQKEAHAGA